MWLAHIDYLYVRSLRHKLVKLLRRYNVSRIRQADFNQTTQVLTMLLQQGGLLLQLQRPVRVGTVVQ